MKKSFALIGMALALAGCTSYSDLYDKGDVASYEVVNQRYKLLWTVPLTTGLTWKEGPYAQYDASRVKCFADECSLDDNLASVRHACKIVGSDKVRNLTSRVDDFSAWSFFLVQKRVIKTSCEIVK